MINKKNLLSFIKANINDNIKITSNVESKNITLSDFKINGQIDMVIKLSYIWAKSNKIGLSSQIYQIKYLAPPEQLNINFIDPEIPTKPFISIPPAPQLPHMYPTPFGSINTEDILLKSSNTELPPQIKLKMIPSMKDLQKAIKGLKPVINKDE